MKYHGSRTDTINWVSVSHEGRTVSVRFTQKMGLLILVRVPGEDLPCGICILQASFYILLGSHQPSLLGKNLVSFSL